jgi:UDP-2,3-diacylglucosamine pyrophosphatase LpxH
MGREIMSVKRVFVSDVHMSPGWSLGKDGCYDWFDKKEADAFARFLATQTADETVQEVILLGDLMDDWVYPIESQPPRYEKIANALHIVSIMENLRELARKKKVTYVMGNHDMTLGEPRFDSFRQAAFDGITFVGSYDTDDGIRAEHGHQYTMYNAVDPKHEVPLGHYISRLAATVSERKNHFYISADIENRFPSTGNYNLSAAGLIRDPLVNAPLTYLADEIGSVDDNTGITTVNGGIITLGEVRQQYAKVGIDWVESHGLLGGIRSAWREAVGLDGVAYEKALKLGKKVIIFGHTHKKENTYLMPPGPVVAPGPAANAFAVYANCGAWCQGIAPTYVVDECEDQGKHTVTLKHWESAAPDVVTEI